MFAKIWRNLFSIQKDDLYRYVKFFGLTLKIPRKNRALRSETTISLGIQNHYDLLPLRSARRLIVFLVPFRDKESDGILTIFRLCRVTREANKDCVCLIATVPAPFTYATNCNQDDEPVYRWEQVIENGIQAEEIYLCLPEHCASSFYGNLKDSEIAILRSRPQLSITILRQSTDATLLADQLSALRHLTDSITQKELSSFSAPFFWDFKNHHQKIYGNKQKIILYSPAHHPMKERVLRSLKEALPDYEFREQQLLHHEAFFIALAEARFCLSFGSDFDSYYIQPYFCSSIGVTAYNELVYDDSGIKSLPFVYETYHQMMQRLPNDIEQACQSQEGYKRLSAQGRDYFKAHLCSQKHLAKQRDFYSGSEELTPCVQLPTEKEELDPSEFSAETTHAKTDMDGEKPLLTVILFTYNHRDSIAKCIESLINQKTDYSYKIHIWDDCSIDGTSDICVRYARQYHDIIKLVVQRENTFIKPGLELQSYAAIRLVDSKYYCYIDGDDYWCDENKVQIALDFLEAHPEYIGFAHDTMQIDTYAKTCQSWVHEVAGYRFENPVTLSAEAPFLMASSRIFRTSGFAELKILPIDYKQYYYHLSLGSIYYYDKIMACYIINKSSTFGNLGRRIINLNSMFPYKLLQMFNYQKDEFCTSLQKVYDEGHRIGNRRHKNLCRFKKIFGIRMGWSLWFFITFVPKFGLECLDENYIYSRKAVKKLADNRVS